MKYRNSRFTQQILALGFLTLFFMGLVFNDGTITSSEKLTPKESTPLSLERSQIQAQIIFNETQLADFASSGDGKSWETAYIIENLEIEQNITDYGIFMANISQYVIFRNIYFHNHYPGDDSSSLLLENVEHLRIENCIFRSYTMKISWGIKIESCNSINLQEVNIYDYFYGVSLNNSFNFLINGSYLSNQIYSQLSFKNSQNISILNNRMSYRNEFEDHGDNLAISSWNISDCEIMGNTIELKNQDIFFWETENVSFYNNYLPNTAFYEVCNLKFNGNEVYNGLRVDSARNVSIAQNIFREGEYGISGDNAYNFTIEQNTFREINGEIFHFRYYSVAPYTHDKFWLTIPTNTTELIQKNTIFVAGPGLWRNLPSNIITKGNIIIPHLGFLILLIVSLYCLLTILYGFWINRRKVKFIQKLNFKLSSQENLYPNESNFQLLTKMEKSKFLQVSILIFTLWGIYASFVYSEIYFMGDLVSSFIYLFTKTNYQSNLSLMTLLSNVEFTIFGFLLCYFTYLKFHKINKVPKVLPPFQQSFTKKERVLTVVAIAGLIIFLISLIIYTMVVIYNGNYPGVALIIGILSVTIFMINLVLKIARKTHYLAIELLLLGIIFIVGYILIVNSIDSSIISMKPPQEVYSTGKLLTWGFIIMGCIAELRAYIGVDDFKMEQGGKNFDGTEKGNQN
ncbi:MAG: NosD domain-containing protein [Promethearchaeota archaeon]